MWIRVIFDRVRIASLVVAAFATVGVACSRTAVTVLRDYQDPQTGFIVRYPQDWAVATDPGSMIVRIVPPTFAKTPETASEFILVTTRRTTTRLDEAARRQAVFSLLPIHGVSLFQRDARSSPAQAWDRFEVTGATGDLEWASIGLIIAGDEAFHIVVCAKPLAQWRTGQHECAQVITTFQPGALKK